MEVAPGPGWRWVGQAKVSTPVLYPAEQMPPVVLRPNRAVGSTTENAKNAEGDLLQDQEFPAFFVFSAFLAVELRFLGRRRRFDCVDLHELDGDVLLGSGGRRGHCRSGCRG